MMNSFTSKQPQIRALITAFLFLTRIPMPRIDDMNGEDSGRSLVYFPWVGLALGGLLYGSAWLLNQYLPASLTAALILTAWVLSTGGLHIDGLADSADGWLSGAHGEKLLEIMKDPRCGSAAVMVVCLLLIAKFAALEFLLQQNLLWPLLIAPLLGRATPLVLLLTTKPASNQGLAQHFTEHASHKAIQLSLVATLLATALIGGMSSTLWAVLISVLLLWGLRHLMMKRLNGYSGDTLGATIEITELCVLIVVAGLITI